MREVYKSKWLRDNEAMLAVEFEAEPNVLNNLPETPH